MLKPVAKKIKSALKQFGNRSRLTTIAVVGLLLVTAWIILPGFEAEPGCRQSPFKSYSGQVEQLIIDDQAYLVAFAQTAAQQTQGLSDTACLPPDNAMLFIYDQPEVSAFWMKDMRYSLDIIWLDDAGKIISIAASATPESYPQTFQPSAPAKYVLEVVAGEAQRRGWQPGQTLIRL